MTDGLEAVQSMPIFWGLVMVLLWGRSGNDSGLATMRRLLMDWRVMEWVDLAWLKLATFTMSGCWATAKKNSSRTGSSLTVALFTVVGPKLADPTWILKKERNNEIQWLINTFIFSCSLTFLDQHLWLRPLQSYLMRRWHQPASVAGYLSLRF